MSSSKKNYASNRDALFGTSSSKSTTRSNNNSANRDALFGTSSSSKKPHRNTSSSTATARQPRTPSSSISSSSVSTLGSTSTSSSRYATNGKKKVIGSVTGQAKVKKMKEAEEYRDKAKKAMQRGMFSRPDPIIAGTYYRRAADLYKQCGENRLERLHRVASGDCQRGQEAFSSAAMEYSRAAELVIESEDPDARKRTESNKLYKDAAEMWMSMNEKGKAGQCFVNAASCLLIGTDEESGKMDKKVLAAFEEAVEAHVPDSLNAFGCMRQTGVSAFKGEKDNSLAREQVVTSPFANETLTVAMKKLVQYHEYKSALYAAGAVTTLLEGDGVSTISLGRSYLSETILQLAMGDVVAADRTFLEHHLQKNSYLTSRECKLAEDLIRAIKSMDQEALDAAKLENRAAMANLDPNMRALVLDLKTTGAVTRKKDGAAPVPSSSRSGKKSSKAKAMAGTAAATAATVAATGTAMSANKATDEEDMDKEMDELMKGLDMDDAPDDIPEEEEEQSEEELSDDEFDLR